MPPNCVTYKGPQDAHTRACVRGAAERGQEDVTTQRFERGLGHGGVTRARV